MRGSATVQLEVPAELAPSLKAVVEFYGAFVHAAEEGDGDPDFGAAEEEIGRLSGLSEAASLGAMLHRLDPETDMVEVDGKQYRRLGLETGDTYCTRRASVYVKRGLYRQVVCGTARPSCRWTCGLVSWRAGTRRWLPRGPPCLRRPCRLARQTWCVARLGSCLTPGVRSSEQVSGWGSAGDARGGHGVWGRVHFDFSV